MELRERGETVPDKRNIQFGAAGLLVRKGRSGHFHFRQSLSFLFPYACAEYALHIQQNIQAALVFNHAVNVLDVNVAEYRMRRLNRISGYTDNLVYFVNHDAKGLFVNMDENETFQRVVFPF